MRGLRGALLAVGGAIVGGPACLATLAVLATIVGANAPFPRPEGAYLVVAALLLGVNGAVSALAAVRSRPFGVGYLVAFAAGLLLFQYLLEAIDAALAGIELHVVLNPLPLLPLVAGFLLVILVRSVLPLRASRSAPH